MRWAFLAVALALAGCATVGPDTEPAAFTVPPLQLPPLTALGRTVEAMQLLTARHGDQTITLEVRLSIDGERLLLAASDLTGRRVMTLRWGGDGTSFERGEGVPDIIRPDAILADLVLLYWPLAAVRDAVTPDGEIADEPGSRIVRRGGRDVLVARYEGSPWNGIVRYRNLVWGYAIEIESRELAR